MSSSRYNIKHPRGFPQRLDGGLNSKFESSIIDGAESTDCLNVVFSAGSVATRLGSTKLNTTLVGSSVCDGLYTRRDDGGSETMIAFHGGSMHGLTGSTFVTISSAESVFTAGERIAAAQYRDNIFVGASSVIGYKWNGAAFTRMGVYSPNNTASFASWSSQGSIGTTTPIYKFSFRNSYTAESDVSTGITLVLGSANVTARINSIPTGLQSWGVASRRIYRSDNGGTTYGLVTTLADNTTTTYDDTVATLGAAPPTDNGVPPKFTACIYHQNRLFVNDSTNLNYVWYSALGEPFTFPSTNFFKVGDASSDLVRGFGIVDDTLTVFCDDSIFINYMPSSDASTWLQRKVSSNFGCKSTFGIWKWRNRLGFPAIQDSKMVGFASVSGIAIEPTATLLTTSSIASDLLSERIEPDIFNIQEAYVKNISSIVFKNKAYITVTYNSGNTTNNRIYLFDFATEKLSNNQKFSFTPFTGIKAAQFTIYDGKLYYGSSTANGFIYRLETSAYSDDGTAIDSYFWTKEFTGERGHEDFIKDFTQLVFLADLAGNYPMKISWIVDSDSGVGQTKTVSLNPGGSLWGTMRFGIDSWGGGRNQQMFQISLGQTYGKRIKFKFDNMNVVNQRFKIHWLSFYYNIRGF